MAIRISIFGSTTKTFGDVSSGDYFIQNGILYCKTEESYNTDLDIMCNAFCVNDGELVKFNDSEGNIIEVKDMDIAVHL